MDRRRRKRREQKEALLSVCAVEIVHQSQPGERLSVYFSSFANGNPVKSNQSRRKDLPLKPPMHAKTPMPLNAKPNSPHSSQHLHHSTPTTLSLAQRLSLHRAKLSSTPHPSRSKLPTSSRLMPAVSG